MKSKIKIVAIAKDEAAYFPEWIHHHLYFGADAIEIHINRTSDASAQVLEHICKQYPQVSWHSADWVDMCPKEASHQIQFVVYANALQQARKEGIYTHLFFLDIDEFWCHTDFRTNLHQVIASCASNKAIFFEWVNDLGDLPAFSYLTQTLTGNLSPLGKTLLPVNSEVKLLRHHLPLLDPQKTPCVLVDGTPFSARKNLVQAVAPECNSLKTAFLFHRAHRSAMEYVSLLYRGRPGDDFAYKSNRTGLPKVRKTSLNITFPDDAFEQYRSAFSTFSDSLDFEPLMLKARAFVENRYNESVKNIPQNLSSNYKGMVRIFANVQIEEVISKFQEFRKEKVGKRPHNVEMLKQFAKNAASQDLDEAIAYLERAHFLRPKGPMIKNMLEKYRSRRDALNSEK